MIVNDKMIAAETSVTMGLRSTNTSTTLRAVGDVRTERARPCSDFNVLHGLRRL